MSFFNLDRKTAENRGAVKEGVHYKLIPDGNGFEKRIFNFDNPDLCKKSGIIELEPVRRTSRHANYLSVTTCYDRDNDIIIGIPIGIDQKTKELMFERITLRDDVVFDLSKPKEAMQWAVIKHHKDIDLDGTKTKFGLKPKYKVYDKEREAEVFHSNRIQKRKAESIAEGLAGSQLRDMAITLGIPADQLSITQLSMQVILFAEKKPKEFMEIWDSPGRHELTVIKKALSCGVITHDPMLGICYNGLPLGQGEPQAVDFLRKNIQVCNTIEQLVSSKELSSNKSMESLNSPIINDEKDAEIIRLKSELAEKEKALKKVAETSINEVVEKTASEIIAADEEHAKMLNEAKTLGVKGAHFIKDKEVLRSKIEERKKSLEN